MDEKKDDIDDEFEDESEDGGYDDEDEKKGVFPERLKLGSSSRWRKDEVLAWIEEQSAKRGGR